MKKTVGVKGFKCDDEGNLYCRPRGTTQFYYENCTEHLRGPIIPCKRGFHFCEDLNTAITHFYGLYDNHFFGKVSTRGKVVEHGLRGSGLTPFKLVSLSLTLEEVFLTSDVLTQLGYKRVTKYKKESKNYWIPNMLFETPALYKKYKKRDRNYIMQIETYKNAGGCMYRLVTSITRPKPKPAKRAG